MGQMVERYCYRTLRADGTKSWRLIPQYSADTDAGWAAMRTVVDRMNDLGWRGFTLRRYTAIEWFAQFQCGDGTMGPEQHGTSGPEATANAALAALGAQDA